MWETYQHRTELLPCNVSSSGATPTPPQPWGAAPKYVTTALNSSPQVCSTITLPSGGALPYNNLDEATQIGQNSLFFPAVPGNPQPATDPQVLFEAKANQYESNYVAQNYQSLIPKFAPFHFSPGITLPTGTVEVKAAWRPLSSIPFDQRYRYHVANVLVYTGSDSAPVATVVPYALLALHIIHKTPNYPAFIFATFEQVDDFQNQATGKPTGVYYVPSYGSVAYQLPKTTTFPPSGTTVTNPNINFSTTAPKATPYGAKPVGLPLGPVTSIPGAKAVNGAVVVPVTSPVPPVPEVTKVNSQALAAMKGIPGFGKSFVWQYYKLTGVQAIPTNDETTRDFYLANIVVESSQPGIQLFPRLPADHWRHAEQSAQSDQRHRLPQQPGQPDLERWVPGVPRRGTDPEWLRFQLPLLRCGRGWLLAGNRRPHLAGCRRGSPVEQEIFQEISVDRLKGSGVMRRFLIRRPRDPRSSPARSWSSACRSRSRRCGTRRHRIGHVADPGCACPAHTMPIAKSSPPAPFRKKDLSRNPPARGIAAIASL